VVVPPQNTEALADAVGDVVERYGEFKSRGKAMSEYARQRFSIPAMVASHVELYNSLLKVKTMRWRNQRSKWMMNIAANLGVRVLCKTR
jgi:hypothetical protein